MRQSAGLSLIFIVAVAGLALPGYGRGPLATASEATSGWSLTGSLNTARYAHTATRLADGTVLVAGGGVGMYCECCCAPDPSSASTGSSELYDPATAAWSDTGRLHTPRLRHTATRLVDGRVLVSGGFAGIDSDSQADSPLKSAEVYDPGTGAWSLTGGFKAIQGEHAATLLPDGRVLAVGRSDYTSAYLAELYDPAAGAWSDAASPSPLLKHGKNAATVLLLNGRVLAVTENSAALYDPAAGTWYRTGKPAAQILRVRMTLLRNGKALLTSGYRLEIYDPAAGGWSDSGTFRTPRREDSMAATELPDGRVLVAGGYSSSSLLAGEEIFDPSARISRVIGRLRWARHFPTATLLVDNRVLVVGGVDNGSDARSFPNAVAELYDPGTRPPLIPQITGATRNGKRLFVAGENFGSGAVILLNGEAQKTRNDDQTPETKLIGKKAGEKVKPGDRLRVQNPDGSLSEEHTYSGS